MAIATPRPIGNTRIPATYRPKLPSKPAVKFPTVGRGTQVPGRIAQPVVRRVPSPPKPPTKPKLPLSPYVNPFARSGSVTGGRIDQGVDYTGKPGAGIGALGPGQITIATTGSGWPGGGFIAEKLSTGSLKNKIIYTSEDVAPTVKVGQTVKAGQQIGYFNQGGYIESGFGAPGGGDTALAEAAGQSSGNVPVGAGAYSTGYGVAFSDLISRLGGPRSSAPYPVVHGSAPPLFSSPGGAVPGVKPLPAFTPVPTPLAGSVPVSYSTPAAGPATGGGKTMAASFKTFRAPTASTPAPAFGAPGGVPISSGSLTGNVTGNALPGFTPSTQGPTAAPKASIGALLVGAAALGGLVWYLAKRS